MKLTKCLKALAEQSYPPWEIVVVHRPDDIETIKVLDQFQMLSLIRCAIDIPGVIHAENLAISHATGEILSFIDDDGYAPRNWCESIRLRFENNPDVVALGGPDNILGDEAYRRKVNVFGHITWYGKLIGNHHHRGQGIHNVCVLKGVNMSVRKECMPFLDPNLVAARRSAHCLQLGFDLYLL